MSASPETAKTKMKLLVETTTMKVSGESGTPMLSGFGK